jgi:excisionase family DNA binding protein
MTVIDTKERHYSVREVSEELGVSICRVHQFIDDGRLNPTMIGNIYLIPESDVRKMKASPRRPGRPPSIG